MKLDVQRTILTVEQVVYSQKNVVFSSNKHMPKVWKS